MVFLFGSNAHEFSRTHRKGHGRVGSATASARWHSGSIEAMAPVPDFWQSSSLDELARRQGVSTPGVVADLFGGWPTDELER